MSQVSYGTITITDTTDIEDVFLIYKGSSSNTVAPSIVWSGSTNDWKTDITQITDDYIWAITVFKRTGITITSANYTDYYSDPVCLTGEPGASINVTSIKYSTVYTQAQPNDNTFTATNPPDVPEGGWLWSRTLFSNGQSMYSKAKQGKSPTVSKTGNTVTIVGADGNTVTVTDGTNGQSYYTYVRYSANFDGSNMVTTPTSSTKYIGVYSGTSSTVPTYTSFTWSKYVGENGSPGGTGPQGVSVISVRELYYLTAGTAPSKPTSSTTIYDDDRVGAWTSVVPAYITNGKYYVSLETTLSNSTKVFSDVILDQALTDANYNAYLAQSLSQNANENANGAMSQAIEAQYQTEALAAKVKHYWWDETGAHIASGINGADVTEGTVSTYGFNSLVGLASMTFGYNSYKTVELDGSTPALKFYKPSKTAQGALTATLNSNGLVLSEGGIKSGDVNAGNSGFIYLSTKNYGSNLTINSHQASNWREIIGTKFGVDADGNLYASNAEISGKITASSLTIGSGATVSGLSTSNISGIDDYALQSDLNIEIAQRKAVYAVSTTGATTAAKTTESGTPSGFVLYNGATVTVKFNSANSTTTPTLNVNGTGAKTIKSYTGAALTAAEYTWPAGAAITFTYDGSYWRMQDSGALQAKADAAASASAASGSATAASNSATSASGSATSASNSANSASNSASSASTSATTATNKANAASESATNAANSATAASGSATSAANSATAASNSATSASNSATAASNSATAAAEVMGGFTILWNYSAFGTSTAGDAFICGFDSATGTKSDINGWVKWNGTKRTITKQQVNPGTIIPYNIPIYIVCRLSSATGTTGTNYMVWYNAGWKYAVCPSPTAVGGSWTWTDNRDIILGSFVETGANEVLTECELFNPPWTSKQITTNTTTPTSYITDTDSNKGITVKPKDSSGNNFLQMNSTAIEFFKNSTTASIMRLTDNNLRLGLETANHTTIDTNGLHIWAGTESTASNKVAQFGSTINLYKPGTTDSLVTIDSNGASFTGTVVANAGSIGGWNISTDNTKSLYYRTDGGSSTIPTPGSGVIILSKGIAGSTIDTGILPGNKNWTITAGNNFGVTTEGHLYATNAKISGALIIGNDTIYQKIDNPPSGANPSELGWYEIINNTYQQTTDTTVVTGKNYYSKDIESNVYTIDEVDEQLEGHQTQINGLDSSIDVLTDSTNEINNRLNNVENSTSYLQVTDDSVSVVSNNSQAKVELAANGLTLYDQNGNSVATYGTNTIIGNENGFHISINAEEGMKFKNGDNEMASINGNAMSIPKSIILEEMKVGKWIWKKQSNDNLTLIWVG